MIFKSKYFGCFFIAVFLLFGYGFVYKNQNKIDQSCAQIIEIRSIDTVKCKSGTYGEFSISVNAESNSITGVYQYYDKWDNKYKSFTDINTFYFTGFFDTDTSAIIIAGWPKIQKTGGKIVFSRDSSILVFLDKQPEGYNDVNFRSVKGVKFALKNYRTWSKISLVKSHKVKLFNEPDSSKSKKGYLIQEDVVKIVSTSKNNWLKVEYSPPGFPEKIMNAWLRQESLYNNDEVLDIK